MVQWNIPKYGALFKLQYPQKACKKGRHFLWIL